jgi:hypothetical protein
LDWDGSSILFSSLQSMIPSSKLCFQDPILCQNL